MGLIAKGKIVGLQERPVKIQNGDDFIETTVFISDGGRPIELKTTDPFDHKCGDMVELQCYIRSYQTRDGKNGFSIMIEKIEKTSNKKAASF